MVDEHQLGFFTNWLAIFIVISLVLYHIILADPKLR